jgi:sugar-specific transcriptional regulator TrmB
MNHHYASLLGLTDRDYQIFCLLNAYGAMPASTVATRLQMNRTTVFSAMRRLIDKGLVFEIPKKGGSYFSAVEPNDLLRKGQQRVDDEEKRFSLLKTLSKQLEAEKGKAGNRPAVSFFEGENGIIALFQKTLTLGKQQEAFLTLDKIPKAILKYLVDDYIAEKRKQKVQSRVLIPDCPRARKYKTLDFEGNRETKFVPKGTAFETELVCCGDALALIDFDGPIGVLIESKTIAATFRSTFELVWGMSVE